MRICACVINCECELSRFSPGDVLVTKVAGPALSHILTKVAGFVAERGGSMLLTRLAAGTLAERPEDRRGRLDYEALAGTAEALRADPAAQILILLPEIALTQALIERITARFGAAPAEWHSGVAPPRRRQVWEAVIAGRCNIVVGARSALFLPFVNLRLVVVDEEHDSSFKQEEGLVYHGRDLAVARARIEGAAVVLASATPSLETLWNARQGRYDWLKLRARHGAGSAADLAEIGRAHV